MQLFISDVHLQAERPALTRGFLGFLQQQATQAQALYILGDLFDLWLGDDAATDYHHGIAQALKQLSQQGTAIYLIHGNRDFALGPAFCQLSGMTLLADEHCLEPHETQLPARLLLLHGDQLCTDDRGYQRMRKIYRTPWIKHLLLNLPLKLRQKIARQTRKTSRELTKNKADYIIDVNHSSVENLMQQWQASLMIHGHTHRPACHSLDLAGMNQPAQRWVLGDWSDTQGSMIQLCNGQLSLHSFDFS